MYARVARVEGATADSQRGLVKMIEASEGPPEGVPSNGIIVLDDYEAGRSLVIGLFATEEDRRVGDEALRTMAPTNDTAGDVSSIEFYEVATERRI